MTSKEFLDRPYHIKKKIRYLELELDRYKVMMNSIPQPSYGTVRVDKTPSTETPNQKALEKYYETEDKIKEIISIAKNNDKNFGNGRFVRNLLEKARMKQASRLVKEDKMFGDNLRILKPDDFEKPSYQQKVSMGFC